VCTDGTVALVCSVALSGEAPKPHSGAPQAARFTGDFNPINPGGFGSNWCGATFVATGKFDLTAMANLK
jgi:hypothetical protein